MTITTFSLPVDIPWKRIAFSEDMIDPVACDRKLPPRWQSSVAVFEYQPPDDQQRTDGSVVSYLKVACTVTGYQADGREIRIRERLGRSGWTTGDLTNQLTEEASHYYPCLGAVLEVVVAPHEDDKRFSLSQYPYFADFDPKKRELYEVVTDTGETMSRSLSDVNVQRGDTTLQSHEVRDTTTLGASLSGSYAGVTASGSIAKESGTVDLSQQTSSNLRTTDGAREARESFSHTTQLSQLYHQLDSYHLGSNRASFFLLPRPHTLQAPSTFVNGPREIEGVQEFMLVVVRPKEMEGFCVEAYLETAHLTGKSIPDWGEKAVPLTLHVESPDTATVFNSSSTPPEPGYVVDRSKGPQGVPLGGGNHGDTGGYVINSVIVDGLPVGDIPDVTPPDGTGYASYSFVVDPETVTVNGRARGLHVNHPPEDIKTALDLSATVYLKRRVPLAIEREPGLMITARAVCSCPLGEITRLARSGPSVVYEKQLSTASARFDPKNRTPMSVPEANQLGEALNRELLQSLASADRYPRGAVSFLDSQFISDMLGSHIEQATRDVNTHLSDWPGVAESVVQQVQAYAPSITRSEVLQMPLAQQVERFGIDFTDAVDLRRALSDLAPPEGPPPLPERVEIETPLIVGLSLYEARPILATVGLVLGTVTTVDSALPSNSIVGQQPSAKTSITLGRQVAVQIASGLSVRMPDLVRAALLTGSVHAP